MCSWCHINHSITGLVLMLVLSALSRAMRCLDAPPFMWQVKRYMTVTSEPLYDHINIRMITYYQWCKMIDLFLIFLNMFVVFVTWFLLLYVCVFIVVCLCFLVGVYIFGVFNQFISDVFSLSISFSLGYKKKYFIIFCVLFCFFLLFFCGIYIYFFNL
jgi:hypothetical protein